MCDHTSLYARPMVDAPGFKCWSRCSTISVVVKTLGCWSSVWSAVEVAALELAVWSTVTFNMYRLKPAGARPAWNVKAIGLDGTVMSEAWKACK